MASTSYKGVNVNMDPGDGDVWDDTELIRAYDKAVKNWRKTNKRDQSEETAGPGPWVDVNACSLAINDKPVELSESDELPKLSPKLIDIGCWIMGSPCRAIYSEDGLEYEAKIVGIQGPRCTVRFVGYGNEEDVNLLDLKTTHGKLTRGRQRRDALQGQSVGIGGTVDEMDDRFSNVSLTSSMYNNYTDSVCRDPDDVTFGSVPSRLASKQFQTSTPRTLKPGGSGPGRSPSYRQFADVTRNLENADLEKASSQPSESVDCGLPSGAEATVGSSSSSEVSSVGDDPEEAGGGPVFTGGEWENFNNTMPHLRFPVPPMPLSVSKNDGTVDFSRGELPALLMSWYMAGYQSGFYDAKQELSSTTSRSAQRSSKSMEERLKRSKVKE